MSNIESELRARAEAGDPAAQIALARDFETCGDMMMARGWFAQAAKTGNVEATRLLAINLLTQDVIVERDGVAMLRSAAARGDAEAEHACGMLAAHDDLLDQRWQVARGHIERAAALGHPFAREELHLFDQNGAASPEPQTLSNRPLLLVFKNFASSEICDWLIERAKPGAERAQIYDPRTGVGREEGVRTNSAVSFNIFQSDLVMMRLRDRIARATGLSLASLENTSILHYEPGQQFAPHFDFLDIKVPAFAREIAIKGQRSATFLLYLNEDYEGGETDFPLLGLSCKGRKGDALLFWSVDESGVPDPLTRHAGLPPTRGEKWILSQWLRRRPA